MEKKMSKIKVLLSYHKPFSLFKSDILTPIHVGRDISLAVSKDIETVSQDKLQWLLDNTIGDNTGDNISQENRKYCELTAQYWAWKNYDKLGNPDYIGFCHYRRHFILNSKFEAKNRTKLAGCYIFDNIYDDYLKDIGFTDDFIKESMEDCDVLAFKPLDLRKDLPNSMPKNLTPRTNYGYYSVLDIADFDKAVEIIKQKYPEFKSITDEYINGHIMYGYNIFIMKKEIFFDYTKWLFDILKEMEKYIDWNNKNIDGYRCLANIAEQLYGIYIYKLINDKKYKVKQKELSLLLEAPVKAEIYPAFASDNIPIVFSSDENYIPYLVTTIQSVVSNSSSKNNYDIIVLETNISEAYKKQIIECFKSYKNISIRFYNIDYILREYNEKLFYIAGHFSKATYYRFFIPSICKHYSKVIYLDCDLVVLDDIANFYQHDIKNNLLGAIPEYMMQAFYRKSSDVKDYVDNIMKMRNVGNYFNAGVLLCNIEKMQQFNFTEKCIQKLKEIKKPRTVDQDILNIVCESHITYLDFSWNYCWHPYFSCFSVMKECLPFDNFTIWLNGMNNSKIIHYTSNIKPWTDATKLLAHYWWKYARMTPFYEEILYKNLKMNPVQQITQIANMDIVRNIKNYSKNRFNYYRCKLLSNLTFGKMRKHYKEKKRALKAKIKEVRRFLKGK